MVQRRTFQIKRVSPQTVVRMYQDPDLHKLLDKKTVVYEKTGEKVGERSGSLAIEIVFQAAMKAGVLK